MVAESSRHDATPPAARPDRAATGRRLPAGPPTRWRICAPDGTVVALHVRQDYTDGSKRLWWERPDGASGLAGVRLTALPLYATERLARLPADHTILLCEGERDTDAVAALGLADVVAVGTVTGAATVPDAAALSPLLPAARVVLWPDADPDGERHMARIAEALRAAGHRDVRRMRDPRARSGQGDGAVDFVRRGGDAVVLRTLIDAAEPIAAAPGGAAAEPAEGRRERSVVAQLLTLSKALELFHDPGGAPYASATVDGRRETWPLPGAACDDWLRRAYFDAHDGAPADAALKQVGATLAARARYGDASHPVFLRVAEADGALYLDLADRSGAALRVAPLGPEDAGPGWEIVPEPPVRFRRGSTAAALPRPEAAGSVADALEELRGLCNLPDGPSLVLVVAWVVAARFPRGPYAPLALGGPQDAGKTTTARFLRHLVDPDDAASLDPPKDAEDLLVSAHDTGCVSLDNLSRVEEWLSDAICRLSDGTALKRRARYTNTEVVTVRACRPVILNGIGDLVTRGDLGSRALHLRLPSLPDEGRLSPEELDRRFAAALPCVLGALATLTARVLATLPMVELTAAPRMVQLARVAVACEQVMGWPEGTALRALAGNADQAAEQALGESAMVEALEAELDARGGEWESSPTGWFDALDDRADERARASRSFPKTASHFSRQLDRITGPLKRRGIEVGRRTVRGEMRVRIGRVAGEVVAAELPGPPGPSNSDDDRPRADSISVQGPGRGPGRGPGNAPAMQPGSRQRAAADAAAGAADVSGGSGQGAGNSAGSRQGPGNVGRCRDPDWTAG